MRTRPDPLFCLPGPSQLAHHLAHPCAHLRTPPCTSAHLCAPLRTLLHTSVHLRAPLRISAHLCAPLHTSTPLHAPPCPPAHLLRFPFPGSSPFSDLPFCP